MNILLQSWRDSLLIFVPKNFSLFFLVTVNNALRTYRHLLFYFWWLIIMQVLVQPFILFSLLAYVKVSPEMMHSVARGIQMVIASLWLSAVYLCVRPSVLQKSIEYFSQYFFSIPYLIGWTFLLFFLHSYFFIPLIVKVPFALVIVGWIFWLYVISVAVLFAFFLLDERITIVNALQALRRAVLMSWYNVPALLVVSGTLIGMWTLLDLVRIGVHAGIVIDGIWQLITMLFFIPIMILFVCTLYIKKVHDQFVLYFQ